VEEDHGENNTQGGDLQGKFPWFFVGDRGGGRKNEYEIKGEGRGITFSNVRER